MSQVINKRWSKYYFSVVLVIVLSGFVRFFRLTHHSLWYDEGLSLLNSDASTFQATLSIIFNQDSTDKFASLYFIVLFFWRHWFGDSEFVLRSLSALLGTGSVIFIFLTTLRLYGKNHAIWSSLLVGFSSFCIYYSQEVRAYSFLIFLSSLQLFLFSKALDKNSSNIKYLKLAFGFLIALGIFSNVLMLNFTVALCLSHIIIYRNPKEWLHWWSPAAVLSLPVFLLYLTLPSVTDPESIPVSRQGFPLIQNALFSLYGLLVGRTYAVPLEQLRGGNKIQVVLSYWPHIFILIVAVTAIVIALFLKLFIYPNPSQHKRLNYVFLSLIINSFLLSLIFTIVVKINLVERHVFYLFPPIAILIPSAFLHTYRHRSSKLSICISKLARFGVIIFIIINIYSGLQYYFNEAHVRDDYRTAVQYILENRDDSAVSILLWGHPRLIKYYGDTLTLDGRKHILDKTSGANLAEKVRKLSDNAETVFLIINREFYWSKEGNNIREMSDLYTLKSKVNFPYFTIYSFTKNKN
jgi:uncharacterized membrane protein